MYAEEAINYDLAIALFSDQLKELYQPRKYDSETDSKIQTRIAQYGIVYRMQTYVPEATVLSDEPD